jgi:DNA gyrase subunit A
VLSVTENGYGKRTELAEYRPQGRGGKGIITMSITERNGPLVGIQVSRPSEELMVITRKGIVIRMAQDTISSMGRNTQGVKLINLDQEDVVATVAPIASSSELEREDASEA